MKQLLLTASACIGLFAFTRIGVSHDQHLASTQHVCTDTTHKPKPDSTGSVVYIGADTTHKPKPDSVRSIAFFSAAADTTHKPKPDSLMLAMR